MALPIQSKEIPMSRLLTALLLAGLLGTTAHADDEHHPPEAAKAPAAIGDKQFAAAYDQLKSMMAQMEKIKATRDPKERQRLMQEHMGSMHEGVQALRPSGGAMMHMMGCQMMKENEKAAGRTCPMMPGSKGKGAPGERMDMMEKRMDMMQMMMEQMVEREVQKPMPRQE
jgi:hypothetical protein